MLSVGGREVLQKGVIQPIPSYAMSVFKLPKQICNSITTTMSKYWWGVDEIKKHMHWFAWWNMCVPKNRGGMGFKDLHCFNMALLAKQCWRLLCEPEALCARVLRAKYFPDGDLLNCSLKKGSSYTWQSLWSGIQTLKREHIWRVGEGSQVNIWNGPLIPISPTQRVMTPRGNRVITKVSELTDTDNRTWDEQLLNELFWPIDVRQIMNIPLALGMMEDFISWHFNRNGTFL